LCCKKKYKGVHRSLKPAFLEFFCFFEIYIYVNFIILFFLLKKVKNMSGKHGCQEADQSTSRGTVTTYFSNNTNSQLDGQMGAFTVQDYSQVFIVFKCAFHSIEKTPEQSIGSAITQQSEEVRKPSIVSETTQQSEEGCVNNNFTLLFFVLVFSLKAYSLNYSNNTQDFIIQTNPRIRRTIETRQRRETRRDRETKTKGKKKKKGEREREKEIERERKREEKEKEKERQKQKRKKEKERERKRKEKEKEKERQKQKRKKEKEREEKQKKMEKKKQKKMEKKEQKEKKYEEESVSKSQAKQPVPEPERQLNVTFFQSFKKLVSLNFYCIYCFTLLPNMFVFLFYCVVLLIVFFVWLHIKMAKCLFINHYLIQAFQPTLCTFLESTKYVTLDKHKNMVSGIDCSSESGALTCFASIDGQISILHEQDNGQAQLFQKKKIWSTDQKKIEKGIDVKISPYHYYEDRKVIAYTENGNFIHLLDVVHMQRFRTFDGHTGHVNTIEFSSFNNGKFLLSGSVDNTTRLWDVETSQLMHTFKGHEGSVSCVGFSYLQSNNNIDKSNNISIIGGNGYTMSSGSHDKTLCTWDIETAKKITTFKHEHQVKSIKYGSNESGIIGANAISSGSADKTVRLWDIREGKQIQTFDGHKDWVTSVDHPPFRINSSEIDIDSDVICSASLDNTIRFWDPRSNKKQLHIIEGNHEDSGITCLKFTLFKKKSKCNDLVMGVNMLYGSLNDDTIITYDKWCLVRNVFLANAIYSAMKMLYDYITKKNKIKFWNDNVEIILFCVFYVC
ncbi:hypothetical protein RFI_37132, partial [Reticulomyxa filosa]